MTCPSWQTFLTSMLFEIIKFPCFLFSMEMFNLLALTSSIFRLLQNDFTSIRSDYLFWLFAEIIEISRNPRGLWSKMSAVLKSWCHSNVIWRHRAILQNSNKTFLDVLLIVLPRFIVLASITFKLGLNMIKIWEMITQRQLLADR